MIAAVCLGFFGSAFALVGMKCTKVGGSDRMKSKIACLAGLIFILCGKYEMIHAQGSGVLWKCISKSRGNGY